VTPTEPNPLFDRGSLRGPHTVPHLPVPPPAGRTSAEPDTDG